MRIRADPEHCYTGLHLLRCQDSIPKPVRLLTHELRHASLALHDLSVEYLT